MLECGSVCLLSENEYHESTSNAIHDDDWPNRKPLRVSSMIIIYVGIFPHLSFGTISDCDALRCDRLWKRILFSLLLQKFIFVLILCVCIWFQIFGIECFVACIGFWMSMQRYLPSDLRLHSSTTMAYSLELLFLLLLLLFLFRSVLYVPNIFILQMPPRAIFIYLTTLLHFETLQRYSHWVWMRVWESVAK